MRTLVLQAYGSERILREARFCIATAQHYLLASNASYRILVYTDSPASFAGSGAGVVIEPLSAATLARWRGAIDFVHRVKLEMLLHALSACEGPILYVDSDTYFLADPAALFALLGDESAVLHELEARLEERSNNLTRKIHRFVTRRSFVLPDGDVVRIPPSTAMWNAGVVGVAPAHAPLLRRALALTDAMYALYPKHVMEQLAISYVLQTRLVLHEARHVVYHYWRHGHELDGVLREFFARREGEPVRDVAAAAVALAPRGTPIPTRRPWYARLLGRAG